MDSKPGTRRGMWIFCIAAGVTLVCVGLMLYVWISMAAAAEYGKLDAQCRNSIAEMRSRHPLRPVLLGTGEPGNAWDDYVSAYEEFKDEEEGDLLRLVVDRSTEADPEYGRTVIARKGRVLELLSRGARRSGSKREYRWENGVSMDVPGLRPILRLADLGILKARALAEENRSREAAGMLISVAQLARDTGDDGPLICGMVGISMLSKVLVEMKDILVAGKLEKDALADLDAALAVLEASYPGHARALANDAVMMTVSMLDEARKTRLGFAKMAFVGAAERWNKLIAGVIAADSLGWIEARREFSRLEEEARSSWNPLVNAVMPAFRTTSGQYRARRSQFRMLRIAIRHQRTGEILALDDPLGSKIKVNHTDGELTVWSAGLDGVDDGGSGGWEDNGKDIVLRLPLK